MQNNNNKSYGLWLKGLYIGEHIEELKATKKEVIEMLNKATIHIDIIETKNCATNTVKLKNSNY